METLLKDGDFADFLIEIGPATTDSFIEFKVFEVISWEHQTNNPLETQIYISGTIKWDGCSHIVFGDKDGYLHLCGKHCWEKHKEVMDAIWAYCTSRIKDFNEEVAK